MPPAIRRPAGAVVAGLARAKAKVKAKAKAAGGGARRRRPGEEGAIGGEGEGETLRWLSTWRSSTVVRWLRPGPCP